MRPESLRNSRTAEPNRLAAGACGSDYGVKLAQSCRYCIGEMFFNVYTGPEVHDGEETSGEHAFDSTVTIPSSLKESAAGGIKAFSEETLTNPENDSDAEPRNQYRPLHSEESVSVDNEQYQLINLPRPKSKITFARNVVVNEIVHTGVHNPEDESGSCSDNCLTMSYVWYVACKKGDDSASAVTADDGVKFERKKAHGMPRIKTATPSFGKNERYDEQQKEQIENEWSKYRKADAVKVLKQLKQPQDIETVEKELLRHLQVKGLTIKQQSILDRQNSEREIKISNTLYEMGFYPQRDDKTKKISVGHKLTFVKTGNPGVETPDEIWKIVKDETDHTRITDTDCEHETKLTVNLISEVNNSKKLKSILKKDK